MLTFATNAHTPFMNSQEAGVRAQASTVSQHRVVSATVPTLIAFLLLSVLPGCAPRQAGSDQCPDINGTVTANKDSPHVDMPDAVDQIIATYLAAEGAPPGCAVGIMQDNQIAFIKGYGLADIQNNLPFSHATACDVGSVSKTWTALAVLRLSELGFLSLEDTVADHIPSAPPTWSNITIRELLSHTSGLQREPAFSSLLNTELELSLFFGFPAQIPWIGIHPRNVYYSYTSTPVVGFEPGFTARYSNAGYLLLGAIIDHIVTTEALALGEEFATYESFAWRQVGLFDGSTSNGDQMISPCLNEYWRQADIPNLAKGYTWDGSSYVYTTYFGSSMLQLGPAGWEGPAGGWTMTVGDLVRLMMAIQNDDIISPAAKAEMMQVYGSDGNGNWGLGVNLIEKLGRDVFMHDGSYPGYKARYTVWPEEQFGVALICNESSADMRDVTDDIASVFIGSPGLQLSVSRSGKVDENDPGLSGVVIENAGLSGVTEREQIRLAAQLRSLCNTQLQVEREQHRLEAHLNARGCTAIATEVIGKYGYSTLKPFMRCYDSAHSEREFGNRVGEVLQGLVRSKSISRPEARELEACARRVYRMRDRCGYALERGVGTEAEHKAKYPTLRRNTEFDSGESE